MQITINQVESRVPVTVLRLQGELDASNFESVIDSAKNAYQAGARNMLIDLKELDFMSSSGLVALHSIVLLMRGEQETNLDAGWEAFHAIGRDLEKGVQQYVKLLNPQPRVMSTLSKTGLDAFFEIYSDQDSAINSFILK